VTGKRGAASFKSKQPKESYHPDFKLFAMGVSMNGFYKSLLVVVFPTLVGCQQGRSKFQAFVWKQILSPALVFEGTTPNSHHCKDPSS